MRYGGEGGGKKGREKNGVCVVCLSKSLFVQMLLSICVCACVHVFSHTVAACSSNEQGLGIAERMGGGRS